MFLFFRKIITLINMFNSLPDNYTDLKFMRDIMKTLNHKKHLLPIVSSAYSCAHDIQGIDAADSRILFITHELSRTGAPNPQSNKDNIWYKPACSFNEKWRNETGFH